MNLLSQNIYNDCVGDFTRKRLVDS